MEPRRQSVSRPRRWCSRTRFLASWLIVLTVVCLVRLARAESRLDGITAVKDEHGRTVYVNAPKPRARREAPHPARSSVLVYWSNTEHHWKRVPPPSPSMMRAARSAADEVTGYVQSQPTLSEVHRTPAPQRKSFTKDVRDALQEPASSNPNYRRVAHGRAVSSGEIDDAIEQAAARHGVDPNLVRAIIKVESNFDPHAVSRKGAMGLMQLMPDTARELNVTNPFDPQQNVDAGVRHLKNLLSSYHGDVRLSLAAYNAGETAVARANGVPNFAETRNYVRQITNLYGSGVPVMARTFSRPHAAPIRMFRSSQGVLTFTNE